MIIQKIKATFLHRPNLQAIFIITLGTLLSRLLGALRTLVVGKLPTIEADIYNLAFILPDNIISIFVIGSITVAILPNIIKLHSENNLKSYEQQNIYVSWCTLFLSSFIAFLSIILITFTPQVLGFLNPQVFNKLVSSGKAEELVSLTRILLCTPLIFAVKTVFGAFLNSIKSFVIYSFDGVISNFGVLFGLIVLYSYFGLNGAGYGVVLGFLLSTLLFIYDCWKHGFKFNLGSFDGLNVYLLETWQNFWPRLFIISNFRVTQTLMTLTAASIDGEISALVIALNLESVFVGLLIGVGTVFLPDITKLYIDKQDKLFWQHLWKYLRASAIFSTIGGILTMLSLPIFFMIINQYKIFGADSFFAQETNQQRVLLFTFITILSIIFQSTGDILNRLFAAVKNVKTPLISSITGNLTAIIIAFLGVNLFKLNPGIAVAISFSINNAVYTSIMGIKVWHDWKKSKLVA